jgi:hypothetical protein
VVGWGSTRGAIEEAVERARAQGLRVSSLHLTFLSPLEPGLKEIFQRFRKVMTVEINYSDEPGGPYITEENRRMGQLAWLLRAQTLVDVDCWTRVLGEPLRPGQILEAIRDHTAPRRCRVSCSMMGCSSPRPSRRDDRVFGITDYEGALPRWCAGCGDHSVLTAMQRLLAAEQLKPEQTVFVSGIGCSSRFPHYMKTYGFHGIHGRALPVATGVKLSRPELPCSW